MNCRHLIVGLTLPLTLCAQVLLATPVHANGLSTTVTLVSSPNPSVYSQPVHAVATLTADGSCTTEGTVQFAVEGVEQGGPVQVVGGQAQSPALIGEDNGPLEVGSHVVDATFTASELTGCDSATSTEQVVNKASTSAAVRVESSRLVADLVAVAPGAGAPSGSVVFSVRGTVLGSAPVHQGLASLSYTLPPGEAGQVVAAYEGDIRFTGSSDSATRRDPIIKTDVRSRLPQTRFGWYRTPVVVDFTCIPGSADLVAGCPAAARLRSSAAGQSVTRTVRAEDGGAATAVVNGLDIDRVQPRLEVLGVRDGATYDEAPTLRCVAEDDLSGLAACRLHRKIEGDAVSYRAVAVDKAGNRRVVSGSYRVV